MPNGQFADFFNTISGEADIPAWAGDLQITPQPTFARAAPGAKIAHF
jgi:hypothetical protein